MESPHNGQKLELTMESPAHGGESVARADGLVVFVPHTIPGDRVAVEVTEAKKRFVRARLLEVLDAGPGRVGSRCLAAEHGAGCCDYSFVAPDVELELKKRVLADQMQRIGRVAELPEIEAVELAPLSGWRTRFRFGVDESGRAGIRASSSNDLVTAFPCAQASDGALDGIVGLDAKRFTPGAEIVVAFDSKGERHVVETRKAARGKSVKRLVKVVEGTGLASQQVGETTFELSALSFWQAHVAAPEAYSELLHDWIRSELGVAANEVTVAWDLYGGVGLFVPTLLRACPEATVYSVEMSKDAGAAGKKALGQERVTFLSQDVAKAVETLPQPQVVVLDPPRKGAGDKVVQGIAKQQPNVVIHIGCDPATFARDIKTWSECGYELKKLRLLNAFPGTHHSETFGLLIPIGK